MRISEIDIDGLAQPIGIDHEKPIFHFAVESGEIGTELFALRLQVVGANAVVFWDTGRISYSGSPYLSYAGIKLEAKEKYQVFLSLWDQNDKEVTARTSFETGFLTTEWKADWIEPRQEEAIEEAELSFMDLIIPNANFWGGEARLRPCQQLRRKFNLSKQIRTARIYASAHGIYQLFLNGAKVSNHRFAPENTAYEKILYYQTYDVTDLCRNGENVLGVMLGDGWWIGRLGMSGESCNYGNRLGFIMQMEITYEDGSCEVICSDESFSCAPSYIEYSDLYIGERQNLQNKEDAWMSGDYDDSSWSPCETADYPKNNLAGQCIDGIAVREELPVKEILHTPKKELVLDFGQVIAGVCRFTIHAKAGMTVTFEHGEVLDRDGNYINNILGRNKDQKDILITAEGQQVFEPQFTYHGFRYVRITGITWEQIVEAKALVMGTPVKKITEFSCSSQELNQLQHNIEWSTMGNMFSVPTDCPQREKLGWTGDIQVFAPTGCFDYDLRSFLQGWLQNVRMEQTPEGEIPVVVPNPSKQERTQRIMSGGSNCSAVWGDACILVPYYLYQAYGNLDVLEENFEMMEQWLSYIQSVCALKPEGYSAFSKEQKERNPYLWTKQYHFGDWLIPSLRALPDGVQRGTEETAAVVGSSYYAVTVDYFIRVCRALKKEELAEQYEELLKKIKAAVCAEFIAADGTVNQSSLQGLYVIVLKAGIPEGELKQKVLENLVRLIHENGNCLDTGFASVSYLLDVLYENGYQDVAYQLLFQTKAPSWLYMVKNGATTIWENWLAVMEDGTPTESSYNHYAFGCVGDFIYRHIAGIIPQAPGCQKVLFAPDLSCGLTESHCTHKTPYGTLEFHWKMNGTECEVQGSVPVGCEAELQLGVVKQKLNSGSFHQKLTLKKTHP